MMQLVPQIWVLKDDHWKVVIVGNEVLYPTYPTAVAHRFGGWWPASEWVRKNYQSCNLFSMEYLPL